MMCFVKRDILKTKSDDKGKNIKRSARTIFLTGRSGPLKVSYEVSSCD